MQDWYRFRGSRCLHVPEPPTLIYGCDGLVQEGTQAAHLAAGTSARSRPTPGRSATAAVTSTSGRSSSGRSTSARSAASTAGSRPRSTSSSSPTRAPGASCTPTSAPSIRCSSSTTPTGSPPPGARRATPTPSTPASAKLDGLPFHLGRHELRLHGRLDGLGRGREDRPAGAALARQEGARWCSSAPRAGRGCRRACSP